MLHLIARVLSFESFCRQLVGRTWNPPRVKEVFIVGRAWLLISEARLMFAP